MPTAPLTPDVSIAPADPRLAGHLVDYPPSVSSECLYQSIELMERYSVELALDLFHQLGLSSALPEWRTPAEIAQAAGFDPSFRFALGWLLERLVETGCVKARPNEKGREYRLESAPPGFDRERLREAILQIDPANSATLALLDHAASMYPAVARGEQKGDDTLLGPAGAALWLDYFNNNNPTYAVNNWASATAAAARLAGRSTLRILELGAGAGSATACLLQMLKERGLLPQLDRYVVTEPNVFFRRRAQRDLAARCDKLSFAGLDMNSPWTEQGINPGEFDLIYGVNVFHVAKDLLFTLGQARAVLAPEGWLVAGECIRPFPDQPIYPELIFQILDSFTDVKTDPAFRPNHGFLTADQWQCAFQRAGFPRVEIAPNTDAIREFYRHFFTGAVCGRA